MHDLLQRYPIISDQVDKQELQVILQELEHVLADGTVGDVAEFGCYVGTTALFMQRLLRQKAQDKQLHVYDSFEGLPAKTNEDLSPAGQQFKAGELAVAKAVFVKQFRQAGVPLPVIHKGWFADLLAADIPAALCFAFLDGDFYDSIQQSLRLVWPRLIPGAIVIVDDYQSLALPGARRAVDEWLRLHPGQLRVEASLAVIRPLV